MATLEKAIQIAVTAHAGRKDKAGAPYILHPLRLMFQMETETARIAVVLHDVVEDSEWTVDQLREEGFAGEILRALECLTKRDGEDYFDFIKRVRGDALAKTVKIADLKDNMDISRIPQPTEKDHKRVEKYKKALALLLAVA